MYRFIRSLIFLLNPETAHELTFSMIKWASVLPGISFTLRKVFTIKHPALEKKLLGLTFKNPVGLAAGLDKDACLYNELADFGFGFIEIGTVTPKAQQGNPKPRLFRIVQDSAIINRMGFNNLGVENAIDKMKKNKHKVIVGGNIGKNTATPNDKAIDDYVYCFNALFDYVDYFVVNVSCPNIKDLHEIQDKGLLLDILETLTKLNFLKPQPKPILLKVAPDLSNIQLDEIIDIVRETKIDGIVATNTTIKRDGLSLAQKQIQEIGNGGLSGRPLTKRSTEVIRYLSEQLGKDFPIIGVGGIMTVEDAIEKLEAGAALIQIYTGFIYKGPFFAKQICKEILKERDQWKPMN